MNPTAKPDGLLTLAGRSYAFHRIGARGIMVAPLPMPPKDERDRQTKPRAVEHLEAVRPPIALG